MIDTYQTKEALAESELPKPREYKRVRIQTPPSIKAT